MKKRVLLLTGAAVGYVLGTRAGRDQYEKIRSQAKTLWADPRVQEQVQHAQQVVKEQAPVVQEKVQGKVHETVSAATSRVSGSGGSSDGTPGASPDGSGLSGDPAQRDPDVQQGGSGI